MWSKLSAGLQKVQDQLDQVLDSQPGEEEEEEEEGGGGTVEVRAFENRARGGLIVGYSLN